MKKDFDAGKLLEIALGASALLALAYLLVYWTDGFPDEAARLGQLGDFLGGILNPTISVLTLFVAISVWQLQKKEVEETRKALEEQAKTAEQQRQEQRFFDLLNVYQRTVDSITADSTTNQTPVRHTGKGAIDLLYRRHAPLKKFDDTGLQPSTNFFEAQTKSNLATTWKEDITPLFDHYFHVVFHLLSEAEALLTDQHIRYIKLFRAQLSRSELIRLAYNLWLDDEGHKMIPLAEKYELLKHLPKGHLRTTLETELPPLVFGRTRAAELAALRPTTANEVAP